MCSMQVAFKHCLEALASTNPIARLFLEAGYTELLITVLKHLYCLPVPIQAKVKVLLLTSKGLSRLLGKFDYKRMTKLKFSSWHNGI